MKEAITLFNPQSLELSGEQIYEQNRLAYFI